MAKGVGAANPPKLKLRWYQFSLRTLFLFVTLCAFGCSWFVVKMQQAVAQRDAVAAIRKLGGAVYYAHEPSKSHPDSTIPGPAWLRSLLGDDFFTTAAGAILDDDGQLKHLHGLPGLETLVLQGTGVTDRGLQYIDKCQKLELVQLFGTAVTDSGLNQLANLHRLGSLYLHSAQLTDSALVHLERLNRLESLDLRSPKLTGSGLVHLRRLGSLKSLGLFSNGIDDSSVVHFHGLGHLKHLDLGDTRITDKGLAALHEALPTCCIELWGRQGSK